MVIATAALESYTTYNVDQTSLCLKKALAASLSNHNDVFAPIDPKQLIGEALRQRVDAINHELCDPGEEDTFFVADLGDVYRQFVRWKKNLPRIKPFYGKPSLCTFNHVSLGSSRS